MAENRTVSVNFGKSGLFLRESAAILFWAYIVIKLFLFDLDVYLVDHLFPTFHWILELRAFAFVGIPAILMLTLGWKRAMTSTLYVVGYPFVVLLWILVSAFKRWPLIIAFAPVIYRTVSEFPKTFLLYAVAAFSGLAVVISFNRIALVLAMAGFAVFLGIHLYRSLRDSYSVGVMGGLLSLLKNFKVSVQRGTFDLSQAPPAPAGSLQGASQGGHQRNPSGLYCLRVLTDTVIDKVRWVTKSRRYDLYLIASWFYTVGITCVVFAFEFAALEKLDRSSFGPSAAQTNFWGFLGFSLGNLTTGIVATILPASQLAILLVYSEKMCALIIFFILVFTVLTAARESYKTEMDELGAELRAVADALDRRLTEVYRMTLDEAELFLMRDQASLVNLIRKSRGLPELPSSVSKADATTSVPISHPVA